MITHISLLLFIRWCEKQSKRALRAADSLSVAIFLCQLLAYNLCFHTLKALRSKQRHCCMRQSFRFQSVDGWTLTDKQKLWQIERSFYAHCRCLNKKKQKKKKKWGMKKLPVEWGCDLTSSSVWHETNFFEDRQTDSESALVIIQTDISDHVTKNRSQRMNRMVIYSKKKTKSWRCLLEKFKDFKHSRKTVILSDQHHGFLR